MDRDDDLTAQWDTDRARAGDALARAIRERDEARAALAAERAAVVAWLRRPLTGIKALTWYARNSYTDQLALADAIERGEHLTGGEGGR